MPQSTIIVPSYDRPDQLSACLQALLGQRDTDFEVVVVDDGSPTPLRDQLPAFAERVRWLRQDNAGPATARNRGAEEAGGAFLAFTDDDCRPRPQWLAALRRAQTGRPARLVGGWVGNGLPENRYAAASQDLCDYLYAYYDAAAGSAPFFTSNNMGCDRERFRALGGFDVGFPLAAAEDRDFGLRWRDAGGCLVYAPDAAVDHHHALTLGRFWRQHANYGRGAHHLHGMLAARGAAPPRPEPPGFYLGLLAWPMRKRGLHGAAESGLMALSQVAMIRGYFDGRRRVART